MNAMQIIIDPLTLDDPAYVPLRGQLVFGNEPQIAALKLLEFFAKAPSWKMKPNPYTGRLIVVEGCDGSGKTTLCKELHRRLLKQGLNVMHLRQPGGTEFGEEIRKMVFETIGTEGMSKDTFRNLMSCQIRELQGELHTILESGAIVLLDRYTVSDYAYSRTHVDLMSKATAALQREVIRDSLAPDLTIWLTGDSAALITRAHSTIKAKAWAEDESFARTVNSAYAEFFANDITVKQIDGLQTAAEVANQAWDRITSLLGLYGDFFTAPIDPAFDHVVVGEA